jgi:hypothetical protein
MTLKNITKNLLPLEKSLQHEIAEAQNLFSDSTLPHFRDHNFSFLNAALKSLHILAFLCTCFAICCSASS